MEARKRDLDILKLELQGCYELHDVGEWNQIWVLCKMNAQPKLLIHFPTHTSWFVSSISKLMFQTLSHFPPISHIEYL